MNPSLMKNYYNRIVDDLFNFKNVFKNVSVGKQILLTPLFNPRGMYIFVDEVCNPPYLEGRIVAGKNNKDQVRLQYILNRINCQIVDSSNDVEVIVLDGIYNDNSGFIYEKIRNILEIIIFELKPPLVQIQGLTNMNTYLSTKIDDLYTIIQPRFLTNYDSTMTTSFKDLFYDNINKLNDETINPSLGRSKTPYQMSKKTTIKKRVAKKGGTYTRKIKGTKHKTRKNNIRVYKNKKKKMSRIMRRKSNITYKK
jgi:hypothetical protein